METAKPVSPALGADPRPVAPSSRISPPAPVAAPGNGEIAVGWLWVSTFMSTCAVAGRGSYRPGPSCAAGSQRRTSWPAMIDALSLYATIVPAPATFSVCRIIPNRDDGIGSPPMTKSALKILCRQCSELAWANIISSTSVGLRPSLVKASTR